MTQLPDLYWLPTEVPSKSQGSMLYDSLNPSWRPAYVDFPPTPENARAGALRAADWLLRTQVSSAENLSGDTGRYYGVRGLYDNAKYLTQNWLAAHCVLGVLAAWHATGDGAYLTSARLGGEYLLGLQVLDARRKHAYGIYREHHARFPLAGARSNASVIWAMVQLYKATGEQEYLDSARLNARWYFDYAFPPGALFPRGECLINTGQWLSEVLHCCYGGIGVIFHQLYQATGEKETLRRGVIEVADNYMRYFLRTDGSRQQSINLKGDPTDDSANSFHQYNDDFAGLSLLTAYKETNDERYLDASLRLARWLAERTEPSGRLGGVSSAPATALVHFLCLRKMTGLVEFDEPMRRFVAYLLRQQVVDMTNSEFHGGIRGQSHVRANDESGQYIDGRTTSYAICGLLGFADPSTKVLLEVE